MQSPTIRDVYRARQTISPFFQRTPLHYSLGLSELLEAEVYLKHEEHLPLGAFKSRGGINLLSNLSDEEKRRGLITSSTGNHGQSIASAGREFGVRVLIGLPQNANPVKVAAMQALGAELIFHGETFDDAREHCERLAREEGYRYVHAVNEPLLIAGVGTAALEIIEDLPDVDVMMLPLGGGFRHFRGLHRGQGHRPVHPGLRRPVRGRSGSLFVMETRGDSPVPDGHLRRGNSYSIRLRTASAHHVGLAG